MEKDTFRATCSIGYLAVFIVVLAKCAFPDGDQPPENIHINLQTDEPGDEAAAISGPWEVTCTGNPSGCAVVHEGSGISLTLPDNWSMDEPYFYQTAGGALADLPSATFFTENAGNVIRVELNPRQWLASNGPCRTLGANQLCMFSGQGEGAESGFDSIASSLRINPTAPGDAPASQPASGHSR